MRRLLFFAVFLFAPTVCSAASTTTWNFVGEKEIQGWNTNNLTQVQLIAQGLAISTETTGQLVKASHMRHKVDRIALTYISPTGTDGIFFWRAPGMEGNDVYQIPMRFAPTTTTKTVVLDMSQISQWDSRSDRIGFVVNAGSQLILQKIEFTGPGLIDRITYPTQTFFHFDRVRPYSVNFLWGPLMTYSQQQMDSLFSRMPPNGESWNKVFYPILFFGFIITVLWNRFMRTSVTWIFLVLLAVLWVIYDLRMGAEFLSYATLDLKTWWKQPIELQDFRDRGSFNAFAKTAAPFIEGKDRYVLIASSGWPFTGSMKYLTYPAKPISFEDDTEGIDTWIVYNRNDITLDAKRRLSLNGEPISPPGGVILDFEPGGFVFVADQ